VGRPFNSIGPKLTPLLNWASGLPDFRSALPDSIAAQSISAQPFLEGPRSLAPVLGCSPSLRFPSFPFLPPRREAAKPARRARRFPRAPQPNQRTAIARNLPHSLSPPRVLQPAIVPPRRQWRAPAMKGALWWTSVPRRSRWVGLETRRRTMRRSRRSSPYACAAGRT